MAARIFLAGVCALVGAATARPALAQETTESTKRGPSGVTKERQRHIVGTVDAIDKDKRVVTVSDEQGQKQTVDVPESMKLDKLKVGDRVNVTYTESLAVSMGKPGEKPSVQAGESASRTPTAQGRKGAAQRQVQATAEVMAVDAEKHEITFKAPDGDVRTVTVDDPTLRDKLATVKPGDSIQLVYTEAIAGSIIPAKKK